MEFLIVLLGIVTLNSVQTVNGTIVTTAPATAGCFAPFIPLQLGDSGVQSVQSVQMLSADQGLFSLVLVKPLAQLSVRGIDAPVELDYFLHCGGQIPIIKDDAYLNFICNSQASLLATTIQRYGRICLDLKETNIWVLPQWMTL